MLSDESVESWNLSLDLPTSLLEKKLSLSFVHRHEAKNAAVISKCRHKFRTKHFQ